MTRINFKEVFNPQQQQKLEELAALAREQGYLTYEEINEVLPLSFDSAEQIDQVLIFLGGLDIQIIDRLVNVDVQFHVDVQGLGGLQLVFKNADMGIQGELRKVDPAGKHG